MSSAETAVPARRECCYGHCGSQERGCVVSGYAMAAAMASASAAAAAAKSFQSCLTLCDPRDDSPLGSPVPGILQARTLEWVAISFPICIS